MPGDTGRAAQAPLVVALVEDDQMLREEIVEHLAAHDFVVHAVSSAAAFDDLAARVALDLFVLDWNLPGESGHGTCDRAELVLARVSEANLATCASRARDRYAALRASVE